MCNILVIYVYFSHLYYVTWPVCPIDAFVNFYKNLLRASICWYLELGCSDVGNEFGHNTLEYWKIINNHQEEKLLHGKTPTLFVDMMITIFKCPSYDDNY